MRPLRIRKLAIDPPLLLAPMAGLTHSALRQIMVGFGGVGLLSTEMLAAKRLPAENPKISPWLIRTETEKPLSYQLLLSSAEELPLAIDSLHRQQADAIDLNMGCPAPTVGKFGAGVRLMDRAEEVRRIVREARKRTELPLTAKIRLGSALDEERLKAFCTLLEAEGIDMLSVHARLRDEPFTRRARWEWIPKIKQWIALPVVVNGGIFSVEDAARCLEISGADGLMIGRGAAIKPWLFADIARQVYDCKISEPAVTLPVLYTAFIDNLNELFRPEKRLGRLKEFTHYFAKNYQFGHLLASKVQSSNSVEEARERAQLFFERNEPNPTGVGPAEE